MPIRKAIFAPLADQGPNFFPQPLLPFPVDLTFQKRWRELLKDMESRFAGPVDLNGLIFLIGVQELGQHAREFKKDEKLALMHVAICVLLAPYGYYREQGRDPDGWPHFERVKNLPPLNEKEQERLMQEAVLDYFER